MNEEQGACLANAPITDLAIIIVTAHAFHGHFSLDLGAQIVTRDQSYIATCSLLGLCTS